ncbi:hypothetical protein [Anaerofustis stercorihominis]|uniref:hypothetical protein n=1 Tax=Anaerofustis stercorihominis TaxID=214853 RepID=UPI0011072035|nr:hypothetical protein [Anaerofustis stercorihominis]
MKKSKSYRVTVKLEYIITMDHTQTSMERAKADVKGLVDNYLRKNNNLDIRNLINNETPHTIYKVEINKNERR